MRFKKKSIFYKGFVFIASLFAMMFLSQFSVEALGECKVFFPKGDQYLTFAGSDIPWTDDSFSETGCAQEGITIQRGNVLVNGVKSETNKFVPKGLPAGHYTVEYKYTEKSMSSNLEKSIFRYVRILNSSFDTSKNYTLGAFDEFNTSKDTHVVNAFYVPTQFDKYIYNFIVNDNKTYVVITNLLGKEILRKEIKASYLGKQEAILAKQIIKKGDNYYIVGNINGADISQPTGIVQPISITASEKMTPDSIRIDTNISKSVKANAIYNGAKEIVNNDSFSIYLLGYDTNDHPIINIYSNSNYADYTIKDFYINNDKTGKYYDAVIKESFIYAVGSYKEIGKAGSNGLYSIIEIANPNGNHTDIIDIIKDFSTFYKIESISNNSNIIVGQTSAVQLSVDGKITATNTRAGYDDALIIELNNEGTNLLYAGMYGTSGDDRFTNIQKLDKNKYFISGRANNDIQSLAYVFDTTDNQYKMIEDNVSRQPNTLINGAVKLSGESQKYGIAYYGSISSGENIKVMDVYYPHHVVHSDPLLLTLDDRAFNDEDQKKLTADDINLTVNDKPNEHEIAYYQYENYFIYYDSSKLFPNEKGNINAHEPGHISMTYSIDNKIGGKIFIYRTINILEKSKPIDLKNESMGILKWYVYNRPFKYTESADIRLNPDEEKYFINNGLSQEKEVRYTANFKYQFRGNKNVNTVFDMIKDYFFNNNIKNYQFEIDDNIQNPKIFKHSSQNTAAFSTIEYAKMFAYYQEFSRVIRVEGRVNGNPITVQDLNAQTYRGQYIEPGKSFYIYYIDLMGKNGNEQPIDVCNIVNGVVNGNCSAKAGYAFSNLQDISNIIRGLIEYNNYFISVKNTIYNGSVAPSEIDEYKQILTTKQYLPTFSIDNKNRDLYLNVIDLRGLEGVYDPNTIIYQGIRQDVYFGGKRNRTSQDTINIVDPNSLNNEIVFENVKEIKQLPNGTSVSVPVYYQGISNPNQIVITTNSCYEIYYTSSILQLRPDDNSGLKGASKTFCLDNQGPVIKYHREDKVVSDISKIETSNSYNSPKYISSDFKITDIIDLDNYAYIRSNGQVFPNSCGEGLVNGKFSEPSQSCLNNIEKEIRKTFRYSKANQTKVNFIEFRDRAGNSTKFYFVLGTRPPIIQQEDTKTTQQGDQTLVEEFKITINFYETNSISVFKINGISKQTCETDDIACYNATSNVDEMLLDSLSSPARAKFEDMVTKYIYAVSYRDRENIEGTIYLKPDPDGIYFDENMNNNIKYKIVENNFVEYDKYFDTKPLQGQKYKKYNEEFVLPNDYFVYNDSIYHYVYSDSKIYGADLKLVYSELKGKPLDWESKYNTYYTQPTKGTYILNTNVNFDRDVIYYSREVIYQDNDNIALSLNANNEFMFNNDDPRKYKIVKKDCNYLEGLPISYPIEEDNTFRIKYPDQDRVIIYTYNPKTGVISYANPLISTSNKIELIFKRTIKNKEGIIEGGVEVPKVVPVYEDKNNTIIKKNPITGLDAYELDSSGASELFHLVDGVYTFSIEENHGSNFGNNIQPVTATLYVKKLDLKIGHAIDYPGIIHNKENGGEYELQDDIHTKLLDFTGKNKGQTNYIQIEALNKQFNYPLPVAGFSKYTDTYFMNKSVFATYTVKDLSVFDIIIYQKKDGFGLPVNPPIEEACTQISIYGNAITADFTPAHTSQCSKIPPIRIDDGQADLKKYGIYRVGGDNKSVNGGYVFNGDQYFYTIILSEYEKNLSQYDLKSEITKNFYIDSKFENKTIKANVINSNKINNEYEFKEIGNGTGSYELIRNIDRKKAIIGKDSKVLFNINYYDELTTQTNENKLLYVDVDINGNKYKCNVAQAISNPTYRNECGIKDNIEIIESPIEGVSGEYNLVFTKNGTYNVTFKDASNNLVVYHFDIDKSAPNIQLNSVSEGIVQEIGDREYIIKSFVKNPIFDITIEDDLSNIVELTYTFIYLGERYVGSINVSDQSNIINRNIGMSGILLDRLNSDKYDGNITLEIYASDELGNTNKDQLLTVKFWVDYKAPSFVVYKENLNSDFIDTSNITSQSLMHKTITVLADEYVSKDVIVESTKKFEFKDIRTETEHIDYKFAMTVTDDHGSLDSYPFLYGFSNNITMEFYDAGIGTQGFKTDDKFPFGIPTNDSENGLLARWIYITIVDSVGNRYIPEPGQEVYLPIIVSDDIHPHIVENGVKKCVQGNAENCLKWETIKPNEYILDGDNQRSVVYASNSDVQVTFNEYINSVESCKMITYFKNGTKSQSNCLEKYPSANNIPYKSKVNTVTFKAEQNDVTIAYKVIVKDFADLASDEFTILIDRIAPEIKGFKDPSDFIQFEYRNQTVGHHPTFNSGYNYSKDIDIDEDQRANFTVKYTFYRYAPMITYHNYISTPTGYQLQPDFQLKSDKKIYYLLVNRANLKDKVCVAKGPKEGYCYVEDVANNYYFNDLLNINTTEDKYQIWTNIALNGELINQIDGYNDIGIYKVGYQVVDAAGNTSEIKYKLVFVSDITTPKLNIKDKWTNEEIYTDVTGENPKHFNGKINSSVKFVATDSPEETKFNAKVLFYKCDIKAYEHGDCTSLDSDELYNHGNVLGKNNYYVFDSATMDGVYKAFVYDSGGYVLKNNTITSNDINSYDDHGVYILSKNMATVSFAIKSRDVKVNYTIHGNRFTNRHSNKNISYVEDTQNYIEIENGSEFKDVKLVQYIEDKTIDKDARKAIGFDHVGTPITLEGGNKLILSYLDAQNRLIYETTYKKIDQLEKLYIHKSYYYIEDTDPILCNINVGNEPSDCELHPDKTYTMESMRAILREDGIYKGIGLKDNYGNVSIRESRTDTLSIDNQAYYGNYDNCDPTGINYWFSVPKDVVKKDNYLHAFDYLYDYQLLTSKPSDWSTKWNEYYYIDLNNNYVINETSKDFKENTYYERLNTLKENVNVYDSKYKDNFNSDLFMAFASEKEAKNYLMNKYIEYIDSLDNEYYFFDIFTGKEIRATASTGAGIYAEFMKKINSMVVKTFTKDKKFDSKLIKQIPYDYTDKGENIADKLDTPTMYEYTYLKRKKSVSDDGVVTYKYIFSGDTCLANKEMGEECIRVNLKIVSRNQEHWLINQGTNLPKHRTKCVSNKKGAFNENDCNEILLGKNNNDLDTVIYIDEDITIDDFDTPHINVTYFGIKVYAETNNLNRQQLGTYVPIAPGLLDRYNKNEVIDNKNGDYLWVDNKMIRLSDIRNSEDFINVGLNEDKVGGMYKKSCEFTVNGKKSTYNNGCVYTTFLPYFIESINGKRPSKNGNYIYNYYTGNYLDTTDTSHQTKSPLETVIKEVNEATKNEKDHEDIKYGFNQEGGICIGKISDTKCRFIPTSVHTKKMSLKIGDNSPIKTNRNSYIEFFNTNDNLSHLFELRTIIRRGKIEEKYSYATLAIKYNDSNEYVYYNINDYLVNIEGYSLVNKKPDDWSDKDNYKNFYTKDSQGNYIPLQAPSEFKTNTYYIHDLVEFVFDLKLESAESIIIMDNANNKVEFNIAHSNVIPQIEYKKDNDTTSSDVTITIRGDSKSNINQLVTDQIIVEKYKYSYDSSTQSIQEQGFERFDTSNQCIGSIDSIGENSLQIHFKFDKTRKYNCSGIYRVIIIDNFLNAMYKEFIFNPYIIDNNIITTIEGEENIIHEYDKGLIVNKFFKVQVNPNLNDVMIYKYPAYSNGNLDSVPVNLIKSKMVDFNNIDNNIDSGCSIHVIGSGDLYTIEINSNNGHECDGVYRVEVIDKFSSILYNFAIDNKFINLQGNNKMQILTKAPSSWGTNIGRYFYIDEYGKYVQVSSSSEEFVENKYYTPVIDSEFIQDISNKFYAVELDSTPPDSTLQSSDTNQNFNISIDNEFAPEDTKKIIIGHSLSFTNKFIKVSWGGAPSYSFASMYYKEEIVGEETVWKKESGNVIYDPGYNAYFEFAPITPGKHIFKFKFVDAVGNEDGTVYTIEINIVLPNVGLFEVKRSEDGRPVVDKKGSIVAGNRYSDNQRISKETILKCIDSSDSHIKHDCDSNEYDYYMRVNGNSYPGYYLFINSIINTDSDFLAGGEDRLKDELVISLDVTIKQKPAIATHLSVIIDKRAPEIKLSNTPVANTSKYTGSIRVSVDDEDRSNKADIYKCSLNPLDEENKGKCLIKYHNEYIENTNPIGQISEDTGFSFEMTELMSGYFLVVAYDDLNNKSSLAFTLDNEAPTIIVNTESNTLAPYMYTNASNVKVTVFDDLTPDNKKTDIKVSYQAFNQEDKKYEENMTYDAFLGFTLEGKYTLIPIDEVGHEGMPFIFYIYRQKPKFTLSGDNNIVKKDASISWKQEENELIAPIVSATIDGKIYKVDFNKDTKTYVGETIKEKGLHTFVLTDAADNRSVIMITISDTNKVCINGNLIEVKMQAYYDIDKLYVGHEPGVTYSTNDVIIYGLPSQTSGVECSEAGALGYRTIDEKNSFYYVSNSSIADSLNNNKYDFVKNGFISKQAYDEIKNIGGTVVVFVVSKDIANNQLGYKVGTNFFVEDPLGWSIIIVSAILFLAPSYRIFIKKKVRVI